MLAAEFGGHGDGPGQFHRPHAWAVDGHGHLYVADTGNHRIQKFQVRPEKPASDK